MSVMNMNTTQADYTVLYELFMREWTLRQIHFIKPISKRWVRSRW